MYTYVPSKSSKQKNLEKKIFICILKVTYKKEEDPEQDPDPLVRGTDPPIRISTKKVGIRNTASNIQRKQDPGPLVRGTDPQIRIYTKMSRIRNTASNIRKKTATWLMLVAAPIWWGACRSPKMVGRMWMVGGACSSIPHCRAVSQILDWKKTRRWPEVTLEIFSNEKGVAVEQKVRN